AFDVGGVVQRCQFDHVFDAAEHFVGDEDGVSEAFAAMHDAMTDGVDVGDAVDAFDAGGFRRGPANDVINGGARGAHVGGRALLRAAFDRRGDDGFAAYAFDRAARQPAVGVASDLVEVCGDELELDRGTAAVENQNIHCTVSSLAAVAFRS